MSAECNTCGSDMIYPEGTWPLGECPRCAPRNRLEDWLEDQGYNDLDVDKIVAQVFNGR